MLATTMPGRVRFVAHAVREIRNRLPDAVAPAEQRHRFEYTRQCGEIRRVWPPFEGLLMSGGTDVLPSTNVPIPVEAAAAVQRLLEEDLAIAGKVRASARKLYVAVVKNRSGRMLADHELAAVEPAIREWVKITGWFESRAHDNGKADGDNDVGEFAEQFDAFEHALHSLIQEFYPATDDLNAIVDEANS